MTDQEIIDFMDWPSVKPEWLREGRSSIWGRTRLLVDEVERRELLKLDALRAELLGALQIGLDAAEEVAERYHQEMHGYRPHVHAMLDDNVKLIKARIEALTAGRPTGACALLRPHEPR